MNVRLGINPLTWSNDDLPLLGADIPLETCLREARAAGFEGVELGHKFPRRAADLAPILARHDLALVSGWYSTHLLERDVEQEFDAMRTHLELLLAMRCEVMVVAECSGSIHGDPLARQSQRPCMPRGRWPEFGARLTALAERMRGSGMRMAYHHHMGTVVQSAQDVDTLMTQSGSAVELLLDTGHLGFAGADPVQVARRHAARIAHVHCKDLRCDVLEAARNRDTSFLDAVLQGIFTVPGDGMIDYAAILAPLAAAGYKGWLVVEAEQDPAIAHPLTYASMGHRNLDAVARQHFR